MISKIASTTQPIAGVSADQPASAPKSADQAGQGGAQQKAEPPTAKTVEPAQEPLLRLEIKHDHEGRFVYTLTDRSTGRTVVEIPREALEALGSSEDYTAGDVVSTKA